MRKKGYLLVECALYIWFCAIFSAMILTLFLPYIKEFKNEIKASTSYNYMLSASMYIENFIYSDNVQRILVDDNKLEIYIDNEGSLEINEIKVKEINRINKLVVEHYRLKNGKDNLMSSDENYIRVATNTILKDVESFYTMKNGNIITVSLKQYGGEERVFCYENRHNE